MTFVKSTAYVLTTTSKWTHLSQGAQSVCLEFFSRNFRARIKLAIVAKTADLHLYPLGGPIFSFQLTCKYDNQQEQTYEIELEIKESDGANYHSAPLINAFFGEVVEIPEGLYS